MKRDVSFRAWDKDEIMLYYEPQSNEEYDFKWVEFFFQKCEVMQFTGKYDSNNKPIYEGDIVRTNKKFYGANIAEVRWLENRCGFFFIARTIGTDVIKSEPYYESAYKMNFLRVEVIGNIYQNPELLNIK